MPTGGKVGARARGLRDGTLFLMAETARKSEVARELLDCGRMFYMENDMANTNIDLNLADSIAMLEQILEVMPQDTEALKAVYGAYAKSGESERAFDYLKRLAEVASSLGDGVTLAFVRQEFPKFETTYPSEVAARLARLRALEVEAPAPRAADASDCEPTPKTTERDISEELALAWRLYEDNQLTQEEYSSVLHDLTEVSTNEVDVPVTVLHVLNDRGFTQMNRIMTYLSTRAGVPYLTLSNFELEERMAEALPMEFAGRDGALPFAFLGTDLLVGVLNPFNHDLVEMVESETGHRCHTYLIGPEDYDAALERLRNLNRAA